MDRPRLVSTPPAQDSPPRTCVPRQGDRAFADLLRPVFRWGSAAGSSGSGSSCSSSSTRSATSSRRTRQGLHVTLPKFVPFFGAYVTIRHAAPRAVAERAHLARRPVRRQRSPRRGLGGRLAHDTSTLRRARVHRLPAQRGQPPPYRLPRRRPIFRGDREYAARLDPVRERRAGRGDARRTAPGTPRSSRSSTLRSRPRSWPASSRRGTVGRSDAAGSRPPPDAPLARVPEGAERAIGEEFFTGFEAVEKIDRPAVSCFGSARVEGGYAPVRARARDGEAVRRGRLGGRDRRRAGRDGGGEPRLPGGRRAVGRVRDRAAARAVDESVPRPRPRLRPLLRAQDDVREGGGGVRRLPRRLRHRRRAVRVARR